MSEPEPKLTHRVEMEVTFVPPGWKFKVGERWVQGPAWLQGPTRVTEVKSDE